MVGGFVDQSSGGTATLGEDLRARREARGMSLIDAARTIQVKPVFLEMLEGNDYRLLPDECYLLRFLRDYALFLGLDPDGAEQRFFGQIARWEGMRIGIVPSDRSLRVSVRHLIPWVLLVVLAIPLAFIGASLLGREPVNVVPVAPGSNPAVGAPADPEGEGAKPEVPQAGPLPEPTRLSSPQPAGEPPPSLPRPLDQHRLEIRAVETTWLLITIDEREIRDMLLQPGDVVALRAAEGFRLTVGNADGVDLVFNGQLIPRLGQPGQVVRDLLLPTLPPPLQGESSDEPGDPR
ncbi:MAG: RodZ domain-containing protein [Candidatus Methylomirabilales bacterium]